MWLAGIPYIRIMQAQNPNIFYTDDDEDDQELFRGALAEVDSSLVLTTANDGDRLLELLSRGQHKPRLIFLDLNMPRKNGYEVLKEMRSDDKLKYCPVVIFSTSSDAAAVEKTRSLGANLFVPKPRSYSGIKKAIETVVNIDWQHFAPASDNFILRIA